MYCAVTKVIILSRSESGFNHVEPEQYKHRLLHFKGTTVHKSKIKFADKVHTYELATLSKYVYVLFCTEQHQSDRSQPSVEESQLWRCLCP